MNEKIQIKLCKCVADAITKHIHENTRVTVYYAECNDYFKWQYEAEEPIGKKVCTINIMDFSYLEETGTNIEDYLFFNEYSYEWMRDSGIKFPELSKEEIIEVIEDSFENYLFQSEIAIFKDVTKRLSKFSPMVFRDYEITSIVKKILFRANKQASTIKNIYYFSKHQKSTNIHFRITAKQYNDLLQKATDQKMQLSEYIRLILFGSPL